MSALLIPHDAWAAEAVTACAVASPRGAALARARIEPDDLWDPRLIRIYRAALAVECVEPDERISAVAAATAIPLADIERMVDDRPVMWDTSGAFARRVVDAARRRAVMTYAASLYNKIGSGARLDELADEMRRLEMAASC